MKTIKSYLGIYQQFLATCFAEASSFRLNFVLLILMDLLFYFTTLASVDFIFQYTDTIGVWSRDEFMFFVAFMLTIDQLHMTFISESFWMLSAHIRQGMLDFILLKPKGTIFSVFFRYIRPASLLNFVITWGLLIYYGSKVDLGFVDWALLPFFILLGLSLLTSLEILISTSMFWVIESFGINFLRMQFQHLSRWPDFVYHSLPRRLFTIVFPILLVGSAPVRFLLNKDEYWWILGMIGAQVVFIFVIRFFWKLGLNRYESASS